MKLFSQRKGFEPVKSVLQVESMNSEMRNGLWDALGIHYWDQMRMRTSIWQRRDIEELCKQLWHLFFKRPIDTINSYWEETYKFLREYYFSCEWYEVYDFIEFIANHYRDNDRPLVNKKFMQFCNSILKRELSGYRFVGGTIAQLTSEEEVIEIEEALRVENSLTPVAIHIKRALDLLADRKSPDYRNSIKESISAVEAICRIVTGDAKATLGHALKAIEKETPLHSAFRSAFGSLYGYTSDAEGIRHSLLQESNLDFEDAKFMLVACSGFVNYLVSKSIKVGIKR